MKLHYGGTRQYSSINIQLNPMACSGKKTFFPSELATAERSLLRSNAVKLKKELMEQIDFLAVSYMLFISYSILCFIRKILMLLLLIRHLVRNTWIEERLEMDHIPSNQHCKSIHSKLIVSLPNQRDLLSLNRSVSMKLVKYIQPQAMTAVKMPIASQITFHTESI